MRASYRETGHTRETPSEYYIRKSDLLTTVYELDDSELIMEIMDGTPTNWTVVLSPRTYDTAMELQSAIRYYEDTLMSLDSDYRRSYSRDDRDHSNRYPPGRAYLVGTRNNLPPPAFPCNDTNISKHGTPKSNGARPCRHCGSEMHWDNDCKYSA